MHRLLHDVVAGEPGVVGPVADLIFQIGPPILPGHLAAKAGGVVGGGNRPHRADRPVVNASVDIALRRGIAPAETSHEREILRDGGGHALTHAPQPLGINRHRLLAEDLLAGGDCRPQMGRAETGVAWLSDPRSGRFFAESSSFSVRRFGMGMP